MQVPIVNTPEWALPAVVLLNTIQQSQPRAKVPGILTQGTFECEGSAYNAEYAFDRCSMSSRHSVILGDTSCPVRALSS